MLYLLKDKEIFYYFYTFILYKRVVTVTVNYSLLEKQWRDRRIEL